MSDSRVLPLSTGSVTLYAVDTSKPYTTEYLAQEEDREIRLFIRHSKEKAKNGQPAMERHTVDTVVTYYATDLAPSYQEQYYSVLRCLPGKGSVVLSEAVSNMLTATSSSMIEELLAWKS